jgi:hypothetical protein
MSSQRVLDTSQTGLVRNIIAVTLMPTNGVASESSPHAKLALSEIGQMPGGAELPGADQIAAPPFR